MTKIYSITGILTAIYFLIIVGVVIAGLFDSLPIGLLLILLYHPLGFVVFGFTLVALLKSIKESNFYKTILFILLTFYFGVSLIYSADLILLIIRHRSFYF